MMKKRILVTTMALAMAFASAMSGMETLTVHATEDGCAREERESDSAGGGGASLPGGSSDSGSSGSSGSGYSGGGSSDNGSSYSENVSSGSSDNVSSSSDSGNSGGTSNTTSSTVTVGNTVSVPGFETWRKVSSATAGTFKVYHKGIEQYTLQLKKDDTSVGFKSAGLYQTEDGRYFINIVLPDNTDGVDAYNVVTMKGDKTYLPKLGISGVCINEKIVVDVDAEIAEAAK